VHVGPAGSAGGEPVVDLSAVRAGYGRRHVLDDVSLHIRHGITVVVGPNGGGKSTLLKVIATLVAPASGSVRLFGRGVLASRDRRQARRSIGYLEQDGRFPAELRVIDALRYAAWLLRVTTDDRAAAVARSMSAFDLGDVSGQRIATLSGGTRQRLMLAAASIHQPALLVLDEPTAGVDPVHRAAIQSVLHHAAPAVVVSTHHLDDIVAFADRVVVISEGRLRFDGSLAELEQIGDGGHDQMRSIQSALAALGGVVHATSKRPDVKAT
jgi:ABC-2 type transport system ATP-binding protein